MWRPPSRSYFLSPFVEETRGMWRPSPRSLLPKSLRKGDERTISQTSPFLLIYRCQEKENEPKIPLTTAGLWLVLF